MSIATVKSRKNNHGLSAYATLVAARRARANKAFGFQPNELSAAEAAKSIRQAIARCECAKARATINAKLIAKNLRQ